MHTVYIVVDITANIFLPLNHQHDRFTVITQYNDYIKSTANIRLHVLVCVFFFLDGLVVLCNARRSALIKIIQHYPQVWCPIGKNV